MNIWIRLLKKCKLPTKNEKGYRKDLPYNFQAMKSYLFPHGAKFNIQASEFFSTFKLVLGKFTENHHTSIIWKQPPREFNPAILDFDYKLKRNELLPTEYFIKIAEQVCYEFHILTGAKPFFVILTRKQGNYVKGEHFASGFHLYILGVLTDTNTLKTLREKCLPMIDSMKLDNIVNSASDIFDAHLTSRSNGLVLLGDFKGPNHGGAYHVAFYAGYSMGWMDSKRIEYSQSTAFIQQHAERLYGFLYEQPEWDIVRAAESTNDETMSESESETGVLNYDLFADHLPVEFASHEYRLWKTYLINCKNAGVSWPSFERWCKKSPKFDANVKTQWDQFECQPEFLKKSAGYLLGLITNHFVVKAMYPEWVSFLLKIHERFFDAELFYCDGDFDYADLVRDYWIDNVISIGESEKTNFVFCPHRGNLWLEMSKSGGVSSTILNHLKDFFDQRRWKMKLVCGAVAKYAKIVKKINRDPLMATMIAQQGKLKGLVTKLASTRFYRALPQILTKWSSIRKDEYNAHFDLDLDSLACKNGLIDLKTGELRHIVKADRISVCCPTLYDAQADTTFVDTIFRDVFRELTAFMQLWLGYQITGRNNLNKFLVHVGAGNNFKSTLDKWMRDTLGPELYQNIPMKALKCDAQNNPFLYNAKTARCLSINETEKNDCFNAGSLKSLTGDDPITAMAKFTNPITYHPKFKLNIFTNHEPELPDDDQAVNRRTWKCPYDKVFLDMNDPVDKLQWSAQKFAAGLIGVKDRLLSDKLKSKRTEFLRWLVLGAKQYYDNGMSIKAPAKINQYTLEYIRKAQTLSIFMKENYVKAKDTIDHRLPLRWVYESYIEHTGRQRSQYNRIRFRKDLEHLNFRVKNMKYKYDGCEKGAQLCVLALARNEDGGCDRMDADGSEAVRADPWNK